MIKNRKITIFFYFLLFILISSIIINSVAGEEFFKNFEKQNLTQDQWIYNEAPAIAVCDQTIHVVWNSWPDEYNCSINYIKSLDYGKTWSNRTILSFNNSTGIYPTINLDKNSIYVAWKDFKNDFPEIYFVKSIDNGENWTKPTRLTYNSSRKTNIYDIGLKVQNNHLYLIWKDYRTGSSEIFFKKSNNNGDTWLEDTRLTYDYHPSYFPSIAVDNKKVYVAFEDRSERFNICLLKSLDDGNAWNNKFYLTDNSTDGQSLYPDIFADKDKLYVVWQDDRTGSNEIFFMKSDDGGINWNDAIQITNDDNSSIIPKLYVNEENIIVIWLEKQNNKFRILYTTSKDGGITWDGNQLLVDDKNCYEIHMEGQADNVHVVFQDYLEAGWSDIYHVWSSSNTPAVTSIEISEMNIVLPSTLKIIVNGFDPQYTGMDLICVIQYLAPESEWIDLDVKYVEDHWEATLDLTESSATGNYILRSKIVNSDSVNSEWVINENLEVKKQKIANSTVSISNFELLIIIIIIIILFSITIIYLKKIKANRRLK